MNTIKARIRFDFAANPAPRRFLWSNADLQDTAKAIRAKQAVLLRSLPFQGLTIDEMDTGHEVYVAPDEATGRDVAYAPLEMVVRADSLSDLMQLTLRNEFRTIKLLEPSEVEFSKLDLERFLFQIATEYQEME